MNIYEPMKISVTSYRRTRLLQGLQLLRRLREPQLLLFDATLQRLQLHLQAGSFSKTATPWRYPLVICYIAIENGHL